jgi:hypothetical protein
VRNDEAEEAAAGKHFLVMAPEELHADHFTAKIANFRPSKTM